MVQWLRRSRVQQLFKGSMAAPFNAFGFASAFNNGSMALRAVQKFNNCSLLIRNW